MLTLFGAALVLMVLVIFLRLRRKARKELGFSAQRIRNNDEAGKMLMRRTRYILHQNNVVTGTDALDVVHLAATAPLSEAPADAVPAPVKESSTSSVGTPSNPHYDRCDDDPDLARKAPGGEMRGPTTVIRRRHDPIGQQAMSYAMRHPEPGKRGVRNTELSVLADNLGIKKRSLNDRIYKARLVLRYNEQAVPLVMNGALSLWKAFDMALELKRQRNANEARKIAQLRPVARPLEQEELAEAA